MLIEHHAYPALHSFPTRRSSDLRRCEAYGRMINDKHFDRVVGLIDDDQVVLGGTRGSAGASGADRASRYLPPTIMTGVDWTDPVMAEEVFGDRKSVV